MAQQQNVAARRRARRRPPCARQQRTQRRTPIRRPTPKDPPDGATVYNSNGDSLGIIDDLLNSGKITQAVISTGSILGIGGKLVAVPFDQLKFEPSAGNNGAPQTAGTPNTPAGSNPLAAGSASTTTAANQAPSHPTYYSVVLPNATKDSLAKQQTFKYASTD